MNQYEVPALITGTFPETSREFCHQAVIGNVYQTMNLLSGFMRNKLARHQFGKVFKCLQLADHIYRNGNAVVKSAIENEFVYSFSLASQSCSKNEWDTVKAHIPYRLYTIYVKQIIGYGC